MLSIVVSGDTASRNVIFLRDIATFLNIMFLIEDLQDTQLLPWISYHVLEESEGGDGNSLIISRVEFSLNGTGIQ